MFNTTKQTNYQSINFNAVSGTLIKSCEESKFARVKVGSNSASAFFNEDKPCRLVQGEYYTMDKVPVQVLQVMLCGEGELLVEYRDVVEEDDE